jgi:hypothetical protein
MEMKLLERTMGHDFGMIRVIHGCENAALWGSRKCCKHCDGDVVVEMKL